MDGDAAQFYKTPILVASEGLSRLELFKEGALVDTVHVYRYTVQQLNALLEEMGQPRNKDLTWDKINAEKDFNNMLNNWQAYHDITISDEQRAAEEAGGQSEELWALIFYFPNLQFIRSLPGSFTKVGAKNFDQTENLQSICKLSLSW